MIMAEAFRLGTESFYFHLQTEPVSQHLREVAQRFGKVAAGLRLDSDDDGKEIDFLKGYALVHALKGTR